MRGKRRKGYPRKQGVLALLRDIRKASPCADCGGCFPAAVMDFDHTRPSEKIAAVATLIGRYVNPSVFMAEISKCEVVCSNCHRIRTLTRRLDREAA